MFEAGGTAVVRAGASRPRGLAHGARDLLPRGSATSAIEGQPPPSQQLSIFWRQSWHHQDERIQKSLWSAPVIGQSIASIVTRGADGGRPGAMRLAGVATTNVCAPAMNEVDCGYGPRGTHVRRSECRWSCSGSKGRWVIRRGGFLVECDRGVWMRERDGGTAGRRSAGCVDGGDRCRSFVADAAASATPCASVHAPGASALRVRERERAR